MCAHMCVCVCMRVQFGVVMSDVKRLPERLECMVFRKRFPEEVEELKPVSLYVQ